jgi:CubicO group peptidase (beta-lactamase class C family)
MPIPSWDNVVAAMSDYVAHAKNRLPRVVLGVELALGERYDTVIERDSAGAWEANTIFSVGSMSKPFIATAILRLIEANPNNYFGTNIPSVALEKPVWTLSGLEELGGGRAKSERMVRPKQRILLKHLLTHTSGLRWIEPYTPANLSPATTHVPCAGSSEYIGSPGLTNECIYDYETDTWEPARTMPLAKVARHVMHQPLLSGAMPGQKFQYSNFDYILLAYIIERATGASFNQYLRTQVFDQLGMGDSFFVAQPPGDPRYDTMLDEGIIEAQRKRIADIVLITDNRQLPPEVAPPLVADAGRDNNFDERRRKWVLAWPEGGMYSTAKNLLAFLGMLRRNGRTDAGQPFLSADSVNLLLTNQLPASVVVCPPPCDNSVTAGFGIVGKQPAGISVGLPEGSIVGEGRFMTFMWLDVAKHISGVFLSQRLPNVFPNQPGGTLDNSRAIGEAAFITFTQLATQLR